MKDRRLGDGAMPPHLHQVNEWAGFRKGDPVTVDGLEGTFTFVSYTTNDRGAPPYVTVWGGRKRHASFRCVAPGRIREGRKT